MEAMPDELYQAWREFDLYYPIDGERLDWNFGHLIRHMYIAAGGSPGKVAAGGDYRLQLRPLVRPRDPAELEAKLRGILGSLKRTQDKSHGR